MLTNSPATMTTMEHVFTSPRKCSCISCYLFILIFITNPLSMYWILLTYQFKVYSIYDYPLYEFRPNFPSITNHCIVHPWDQQSTEIHHTQKLNRVYDCRDENPLHTKSKEEKDKNNKQITIGIASFHHYPNKNELTRYEQLILSNHIGYGIKHRYIYFDVNELIFNDNNIKKYFDSTIPSANAIFKAQKPFIVHKILTDNYYKDIIDYVLWIDFDAIFFNCSISIESIINYTHKLYSRDDNIYKYPDKNSIDIIFARDYFSITNSGVIIYKNTNWVKQLLLKQMYVFQHAKLFRFSDIYLNVRHLVDQNVFNALIMGFDPKLDNTEYLTSNRGYNELKEILKYELKVHELIPDFQSWSKCLVDEEQYISIHNEWIGDNVRNHSAMIPQVYINLIMGEWIYAKYYQYHTLKHDPVIVHFASSIGKVYLSSPDFRQLRCSIHDYA